LAFAAVTYQVHNLFQNVSHSQIQQDSPGASQVAHFTDVDLTQLLMVLEKVRLNIDRLGLTKAQEDEALAEVATLEAHAKSPKPKHGVIRNTVRSLKNVLEAAAGGAIGGALESFGKAVIVNVFLSLFIFWIA
jgi:hypothetical protein